MGAAVAGLASPDLAAEVEVEEGCFAATGPGWALFAGRTAWAESATPDLPLAEVAGAATPRLGVLAEACSTEKEGIGELGISFLGIAFVGIAVVGIAFVGIAFVGIAVVGIAFVGIGVVGIDCEGMENDGMPAVGIEPEDAAPNPMLPIP